MSAEKSSSIESALVIGAGVAGMATAYTLARRGISVTVVDAAKGAGEGASYGNGAQLSYNYTDALASPHIWRELPSFLTGRDNAFRAKFHMDPAYLCWLGKFLANANTARFRQNTLSVLQLAQESRGALRSVQDEHGLNFDHATPGKLHLYSSQKGFDWAISVKNLKSEIGCEQTVLDPDAVADLEPALVGKKKEIVGAIHSPSDAVGDAHMFCLEMHRLLVTEFQTDFVFAQRVEQLELDHGQAQIRFENGEVLASDIVIVCAGACTSELLSPHKLAIPIQPMKGYSFEIPATNRSPNISITDASRRIVFTRLGDKVRIAGLADLGYPTSDIDNARLETLVATAKESMPLAGDYDRPGGFWAGLRPMTPDSRPIITRPRSNLAINSGHGMLGWTLAMGSAQRLARLI